MTLYGNDFYGNATYGAPPAGVQYSVAPFRVVATDYGLLTATWNTPQGTDWTDLRLVRNHQGFPVDENDGFVLVDEPAASAPRSYVDMGLAPLAGYQYAIFVKVGTLWIRVALAMGIVPHAWATPFYEQIPQFYRDDDQDVPQYEPLRRFLSVFTLQYDLVRTEFERVLHARDPGRSPIAFVPALANQYGVQHEPTLGGKRTRLIIANAVYLAKTKGTQKGIEAAARAYSGYDASAAMSSATNVRVTLKANRVNLVLNPSAEVDTAGWAGTNAALSRSVDRAAPASGAASFSLVNAAVTDRVYMETPTSVTDANRIQLPDVGANRYALTAFGWTNWTDAYRFYELSLRWYDAAGVLLTQGSTLAAAVLNTWVRMSDIAVSPEAAAYVSVLLMHTALPPTGVNSDLPINTVTAFDGILLERAGGTETGLEKPYFDGSSGGSDYMWEGTPHLSRSHYYYRRGMTNGRLTQVMPRYIPAGMTVDFLYAQP